MGKAFGWVWSSFIHFSVAGVGFYTYWVQSVPDEGPDLASRSSVARPLIMDFGRERVPVTFEQPTDQPTPVEPEEVTVEIEREAAEPIELQEFVRADRPEPSFKRPLRCSTAKIPPPANVASQPTPEVEENPPADAPVAESATQVEEIKSESLKLPVVYPRLAEKRGWEGEVLLEVRILEDGRCGSAVIVQGDRYRPFEDNARNGVLNFTFPPEIRGTWRIRVSFRLQG